MQQRVNLARALAVNPRILLMDEPFAALDAQTRNFMQLELLRIWAETKKTVIFVTHMIAEAVLLSDRVIVFTHRPGTIRSEFKVPLARPRDMDIKSDPRFLNWRTNLETNRRRGKARRAASPTSNQHSRSIDAQRD